MTREEWKERLPLIQAFIDGEAIEVLNYQTGKWNESESIAFTSFIDGYRIKAMPKYRPFKDAEECWQEMLKHQPFGWITLQCGQKSGSKASIIKLTDNCFYFVGDGSGICHNLYNYEFDKHFWLFADGTPFGIKVEEE